MRSLTPEQEARIANALATRRGPFGEPPCTLSFGPRRIEIWAPQHIGRTAQAIAGGFAAYEIVRLVREMGFRSSLRLAPRPSEPRLTIVVAIGAATARPTAPENPPTARHGTWWCFEALAGAADAEGARLCRLDRELAEEQLGLKLERTETPIVLCTWGNGAAAWARAGVALAHVLEVGRTEEIPVNVAALEIQGRARRNGIGVIEPDLGWTQIVLVMSGVSSTHPSREGEGCVAVQGN